MTKELIDYITDLLINRVENEGIEIRDVLMPTIDPNHDASTEVLRLWQWLKYANALQESAEQR